jgi:chromosome partitioning protein
LSECAHLCAGEDTGKLPSRLVIANQRGGVSKTTTTHTLARYYADQGLRVLMIDTDPQGSLSLSLGAEPTYHLHDFVVNQVAFQDVVVAVHGNIDLVCSNRDTTKAEIHLLGSTAGELVFLKVFGAVDRAYDLVLIDCAPSISQLQAASIMYAKRVLIPAAMDMLSLNGAQATIVGVDILREAFEVDIEVVGIMPTMIDRRFNMTQLTLGALEKLAVDQDIPLLRGIRTDGAVPKAGRKRAFLVDFDPKCKALEDYYAVAEAITEKLNVQLPAASDGQADIAQVAV